MLCQHILCKNPRHPWYSSTIHYTVHMHWGIFPWSYSLLSKGSVSNTMFNHGFTIEMKIHDKSPNECLRYYTTCQHWGLLVLLLGVGQPNYTTRFQSMFCYVWHSWWLSLTNKIPISSLWLLHCHAVCMSSLSKWTHTNQLLSDRFGSLFTCSCVLIVIMYVCVGELGHALHV